MDGYAREAVASFAAALERFMEFYVRAFTLERAANTEINFEDALRTLEGTWRHVVSQSERQVGMFALAYLLREGKEPDFLNAKSLGADFRNKVIHRGYLPKRAEVEAYAAQVFALIDRLLTELGQTATHAELAQESEFTKHMQGLPDKVIIVFEEHPGMFRARRFGTLSPMPKPKKLTSKLSTQVAMNDAQNFQDKHLQKALFQQALAERGALLKRFK